MQTQAAPMTSHSRPMPQVRILLAGLRQNPNQFTRALDRYPNVKVIHFEGAPGKRFPTDCDALVICTSWNSHDVFWRTKDAYTAQKKRVFISATGFSPIKEDFEKWLDSYEPPEVLHPVLPPPPEKTALEIAFNEATAKAKLQPTITVATPQGEVMKKDDEKLSRRELGPGVKLIRECFEAGMDNKETLEYLHAHKVVGPRTGKPYEMVDVHAGRYHWKNATGEPVGKRGRPRLNPLAPQSQPAPATVPKAAPKDALSLIEQVMKSNRTPEAKLQMIERIQRGEVLSERIVTQVTANGDLRLSIEFPVAGTVNYLMTVNRVQAAALLQATPELKKYLGEG